MLIAIKQQRWNALGVVLVRTDSSTMARAASQRKTVNAFLKPQNNIIRRRPSYFKMAVRKNAPAATSNGAVTTFNALAQKNATSICKVKKNAGPNMSVPKDTNGQSGQMLTLPKTETTEKVRKRRGNDFQGTEFVLIRTMLRDDRAKAERYETVFYWLLAAFIVASCKQSVGL